MRPPLLQCKVCGGELVPLGDLAASLDDAGRQAWSASTALETMRLALPSAVPLILRDLAASLPRLADRVRCAAGACSPPAGE